MINKDAVVGPTGNENGAILDYNNNPYNSSSWESVDPTVKVYTYGIKITKVNEEDHPLTGAEFKLSKKSDGSDAMYFVKTAEGKYRVATSGTESGAGHIEATALPIGGSGRHAVLTGHRGIPGAELFTRLDEMERGDIFLIHVLGRTLAYEVDEINTVLPTELYDIHPVQGRDLVTLLTCTPYGVNTHRLLVRGSRTEYVPQDENVSGGAETEDAQPGGFYFKLSADGILLGAVLTAGSAVLYVVWSRRRHGR